MMVSFPSVTRGQSASSSSNVMLLCKIVLTVCVISTQLLHSKASQALVQGDEESTYQLQGGVSGGSRKGGRGSRWGTRDDWRVRDYQRKSRYGSGYASGMMDDDDEDHGTYSSGSGSGYWEREKQPPYKTGRDDTSKSDDDIFIDNAYQTPQSDLIHSGASRSTSYISLATVTTVTIATVYLWLNG